jgi:hypothetical protein
LTSADLKGMQVTPEEQRKCRIAVRHGIPDLSQQLVGRTAAELEADAAAKAALQNPGGEAAR